MLWTTISGPNHESWMVVITSWLRSLKIQTLLTPGKAHGESWLMGKWMTPWWMEPWWNTEIPWPPPLPHQTVLFLGRTGCITPPALGKMSAWCSRIAAGAASFLITFASQVLTALCLLLSEGASILKPAARKWNCWNSRGFCQFWRRGRQDNEMIGCPDPCRLIKQEEWWRSSFSTELSLCGNLIKPWLSSTCSSQWLLLHERHFTLPYRAYFLPLSCQDFGTYKIVSESNTKYQKCTNIMHVTADLGLMTDVF